MKKIAALLALVMIFAACSALAEDFSTLSDEELLKLSEGIREELDRRGIETAEEDGTPENVTVFMNITTPTDELICSRATEFFSAWADSDMDSMLALCLPAWKEKAGDPEKELTGILQNRTPASAEASLITPGEPEDPERTVAVIAIMDRNDGTEPKESFLEVRMAKGDDGIWYVDPEGIREYEDEETETTAEEEARVILKDMAEFFEAWRDNRQDIMLEYCLPEWKQEDDEPKVRLFTILNNRTVKSIDVDKIIWQDDRACEMIVMAEFDRQNGKPCEKHIMRIRLVKEDDGFWYVDPESLRNMEQTGNPEEMPEVYRNLVTGTPDSQELYYLPNGGKYYHTDPDCECINPTYRPMEDSFTYGELLEGAHSELEPCLVCMAPLKP